jgi:hypothetical protein
MPEETFWFKLREKGTWFWVSMVIIFGHFFLPFLSLLRIDVKENFKFMLPLVAWAWLMHYVDMAFNVIKRNRVAGIKAMIAVASGKGGVGKSTVAVNLACALHQLGYKTIPVLAAFPAGRPNEVLVLTDLVTPRQVIDLLNRAVSDSGTDEPERGHGQDSGILG